TPKNTSRRVRLGINSESAPLNTTIAAKVATRKSRSVIRYTLPSSRLHVSPRWPLPFLRPQPHQISRAPVPALLRDSDRPATPPSAPAQALRVCVRRPRAEAPRAQRAVDGSSLVSRGATAQSPRPPERGTRRSPC